MMKMTKRQTRQRARVPDYTPASASGLRLVVRLFQYERPPQAKYRQFVLVPGRAAKLTIKHASQLVVLWSRIEDVIEQFAQDMEREG